MPVVRTLSGPGLVAVAAAVTLVAAGCGGSSGSPAASGTTGAQQSTTPATVETRTIKGLGTVLVDSRGLTLYVFAPDQQKQVTCTGGCAAVWPPLKLKAGSTATAGGTAQASLLGSDPDPDGGSVVTYASWPLYTYVADTGPGQAKGQALDLNGGFWYVISPSGTLIKTKPSSSSSSAY